MAFTKGMADRPESLRFPQSPRDDPPFPTYTSSLSPLRSLNGRANGSTTTAGDVRGSLTRRFTTNAVPTTLALSPIGQQRRLAVEPRDYLSTSTTFNRIGPAERKARQYEELLAQQRRIQAQMDLIDPETRREVDEVKRLEQDIHRFTSGHQSEPTTPPEYYSYPSAVSRPNRYSSSALTSPPGLANRPARSGSQLTSPPASYVRPFSSHAAVNQLPSKSVPGSRRNSDEEEEEDDYTYGFSDSRAAANLNRNSMPVTGYDLRNKTSMMDLASLLGHVNTTSFLFGDDDDNKPVKQAQNTASPDAKTYLQLYTTDDQFPILVRREGDGPMQLSASSAALDLALSQSPGPEAQQAADKAKRHRQSLPPSAMRQTSYLGGDGAMSPLNSILSDLATAKNTAANRRSLEVKFAGVTENKRPSLLTSSPNAGANGFPRLQSSYSTNDIPTLKSTKTTSPAERKAVAIQDPQTDYRSPDRTQVNLATLNALTGPDNRQAQDLHNSFTQLEEQNNGFRSPQTGLQASAAPFGPSVVAPSQESGNTGTAVPAAQPIAPYGAPAAFYGGYGMQILNGAFNNMYIGGNQGYGQMPIYPGAYGGYSQYPQPAAARYPDSQNRVTQQRRTQNGDENARFANIKLESLTGEIHQLCKDQHGCRYLQKKLEDRNPEQVQMIFEETAPHVIELMTDPFGNYLCQKLLEYANDDQRTTLIRNASPQMVKIALNQHGTRALQKMIEFVSTPQQINMIIDALKYEVVPLIQDLNGNHVIQKCLNHLSAADAQFIFNAVGTNCVIVGTHRHGCCVLQRCIDHASGEQKGQLVGHITNNAFALVQDPFGNYVVQYILDLGEPTFTEPLCRGFVGNVVLLSKQKFSSNVIEKCIRTASDDTKRLLIEEMLNPVELDKLLRDSFANYVVQTAMDFSDPDTKVRLVESIRPILPTIRHTPYGRRIQGKIQEYDSRMGGPSGHLASSDVLSPGQLSISSQGTPYGRQNGYSAVASPLNRGGNYANITSPTPNRGANAPGVMFGRNGAPPVFGQGFPGLGRAPQANGMGQY